jgi:hypothetical protein
MRNDITHSLPPIIARHVAAYGDHDPEAFMATLAPDALLNDNRREFLGHDAIRAWADKEIFGDKVSLTVERAYEQYGAVTLHARTEGDYDKTNLPDPLILSFYFTVTGERITQLIITHNQSIA